MKFNTNEYIKLELEVKTTERINVLKTPVPSVNTAGDNQSVNPGFLIGNSANGDPGVSQADSNNWNSPTNTGWDSFNNTVATQGTYYWDLTRQLVDDVYRLTIAAENPFDPNFVPTAQELLNPQVYTTVGMEARPNEEWSGSLVASGAGWRYELWAFNGNTPISAIASGNGTGSVTISSTGLTPANTTNVRWRFYTNEFVTVTVWNVSASRFIRTHAGWSGQRIIAVPTGDWWTAVGPTAFYSTGDIVSDQFNMTQAGQYVGAAMDIWGVGSGTLTLNFYSSSNTVIKTETTTVTSKNIKRRLQVSGLAPAGTTHVRMIVNVGTATYWDAAVLVLGDTTPESVQQLGFFETAGDYVTNGILNSGNTGALNGWTPTGTNTIAHDDRVAVEELYQPYTSGIILSFPTQPQAPYGEDKNIAAVPSVYSNTVEILPGQWVLGSMQLAGSGYARIRYEWLSATGAHVGYSLYSPGRFVNSTRAGTMSGSSNGVWSTYLYGDTIQAPADAYQVRMHLEVHRSAGMPLGPYSVGGRYVFNFETQQYDFWSYGNAIADRVRFRNAVLAVGTSAGAVKGEPVTDSATYVDLFNSSTSITIDREPMEPGILTASVHDSDFDPNTNFSVRPEARVRATAIRNGVSVPLFTGRLDDIDVSYADKRPSITMRAIDNTRTLFTEPDTYGGVSTINALDSVMIGSNVEWILQASDSATATKRTLAGGSKGDQVLTTRDTTRGYAFINKENKLVVRGPDYVYPASQVLFSDIVNTSNPLWQTYALGVDVGFSADDVINSVTIKELSIVDGETVETEYPPVENGPSINEWGLHPVEITINAGVDRTAYANAILNAHASPAPQVNGLTFPVEDARSFGHAIDLELCDIVDVQYSPVGLNKEYRTSRIIHRIDPYSWIVECEFRGAGLTAGFVQSTGSLSTSSAPAPVEPAIVPYGRWLLTGGSQTVGQDALASFASSTGEGQGGVSRISNTTFRVTEPGLYQVSFAIRAATGTAGERYAALYNPVTGERYMASNSQGSGSACMTASTVLKLTGQTDFGILCYFNGGNMTVTSDFGGTSISFVRVG